MGKALLISRKGENLLRYLSRPIKTVPLRCLGTRRPWLPPALLVLLLLVVTPGLSFAARAAESEEIRATDLPIEIDGALGDAAWKDATRVALEYEWNPGENIKPPVATEVFLVRTSTHLYIAWRCFDPEPEKIRAHLMDRDDVSTLVQDDHVLVTLDTFNDNRRGYQFRINPLGVQADAILSPNDEDFSFDMIWRSAGKIDDRGYVVEVEIPFSQMRFSTADGGDVWGIDLGRSYPRNVRHRITAQPLDRNDNCRPCQARRFSGFTDLEAGRNLEITPTVTAVRADQRENFPNGRMVAGDEDFEAGVSARWGITPNFSLNATINPDFSQVEADAAQLDVNQRFALFFSEQRPFFLEGSDYFDTPIRAVFTRTVVDPDWGLKVTGKTGKNALGAFFAQDSVNSLIFSGNQFSRRTLLQDDTTSGVLRYRRDVGENSYVGGLVTSREGDDYSNHVYGVDGLLRFDSRNSLRLQYLRSETRYPGEVAEEFDQPEGTFSGDAFKLGYNYSSRDWEGWFWYDDKDEGFRADSGFVPQTDVREMNTGIERVFWPEADTWWNRFSTWVRYRRSEDQQGTLSAEWFEGSVSVEGPLQSLAFFEVSERREFFSGVVHEGIFSTSLFARFQPSGKTRLSLFVVGGEAVDYSNNQLGDQLRVRPNIVWKFGRRTNAELSHTRFTLDVPGGELFEVNLSELRVVYNFSVRSFVRAIFQYEQLERDPALYSFDVDPSEDTLLAQLLYSYKINPQTVFFAGYSENRLGLQGIPLTETDRTFFMKVGYAWTP